MDFYFRHLQLINNSSQIYRTIFNQPSTFETLMKHDNVQI